MNNRARNRSRAMCRLASLLIMAAALPVNAQPIGILTGEGVSITLYDEDCTLKETVINLPKRAVWRQDGKAVEGCWGFHPQTGIVSFYYADKTVASIPGQAFRKLEGA